MKTKRKSPARLLSALLSFALAASLLAALPAAAGTTSSSSSSSVSSSETPAGGSPEITAYTVQDAAGNEIQQLQQNQKCQIIIAISDPRFSALDQISGSSSYANAKITSTASFKTPSLGDIKFTTPKISGGTLHYAIIFNDITYLGGDNKLAFDLSYQNQAVALVNLSQAISQCVGSTTTGGKASALVIKSASYGASEVQAGKEFDLTAEILAAAGTTAVDMVQVSLTLPEKISVVSGNSNYYVGKMNADTTSAVSFKLLASAVADPGSYAVTINVTGVGSDGTAVTNSLNVTVPVVQPERFEITNLSVPSPLLTGEENTITVTYVNKGKGIIYNLSAEIAGAGMDSEGQNQYVGNVAAGTEGSTDFTISSQTAGTINGKVTLTYEDAKGQQKTLEKAFSVDVQQNDSSMVNSGMVDSGVVDPGAQTSGGMPWWGWVVIAAVVVAVLIVIARIIKKQKAKKQRLEDEDEDI